MMFLNYNRQMGLTRAPYKRKVLVPGDFEFDIIRLNGRF